LPALVDPVAAGDAEGRGGEFGQQVQPQVVGVEPDLARQAGDHLALDPGAVVLDVLEQRRLGDDQAAGGEEALVPAWVEPRHGRGQGVVQLAQDGAGQLTVGERGQVGRPQLGLGLDRRRLLGREEAEERALGDLGLLGQFLQRGLVEAMVSEQAHGGVGQRAAGPQLLPLAQRQGPIGGHPRIQPHQGLRVKKYLVFFKT